MPVSHRRTQQHPSPIPVHIVSRPSLLVNMATGHEIVCTGHGTHPSRISLDELGHHWHELAIVNHTVLGGWREADEQSQWHREIRALVAGHATRHGMRWDGVGWDEKGLGMRWDGGHPVGVCSSDDGIDLA